MATILVVEDSAATRWIIKETLENAGHTVVPAADGIQALAAVRDAQELNLVITDLEMPNMKGRELIRALAMFPRFHNIPILVLTANSAESTKDQVKNLGVHGWLGKPFDPVTAIKTIEQVLLSAGKNLDAVS